MPPYYDNINFITIKTQFKIQNAQKGHLSDGLTLRKWNKTTCREGAWELKRNQSLFKNRHGGAYDRKPVSTTIPILSRKAQIKEMLFFTFQCNTKYR